MELPAKRVQRFADLTTGFMDDAGQDAWMEAIDNGEPALTPSQMLAQAQLCCVWTPPDGACLYWGAMLALGRGPAVDGACCVFPSDIYERFPRPSSAERAGSDEAAALCREMRTLRRDGVAWVMMPEQRKLFRNEPDLCPTFAQFAARQLNALPSAERRQLRCEARRAGEAGFGGDGDFTGTQALTLLVHGWLQ